MTYFRSKNKNPNYKDKVHDIKDRQERMMKPIFSKTKGGYQMDYFVQKNGVPQYYLIFINVNSRHGYAYPSYSRSTQDTLRILKKFVSEVKEINSITSDREASFISQQVIDYLIDQNIDLQTTEDNDKKRLGIIDRFIRTIRDMHDDDDGISESEMQSILHEYNNSPHSKIQHTPIQFEKDISAEPKYIQALEDYTDELEAKFPLHKNQTVRIQLPKSKFKKVRRNYSKYHVKVIDRIKNQYLVQAKDKSVDLYSRYQLNTNTKNTKAEESINNDKKGYIKRIIRDVGKG
jgi:hypothetical protein